MFMAWANSSVRCFWGGLSSERRGFWAVNPSAFIKGDTLPVNRVSWDDCQEFCERAGLSLPTEAQWEYACRAGTSGPYSGTGKLDDMGSNSGRGTHPVGANQANDFGPYDMHGNVLEWCEDWIQEDFYQESTGARDPLCENSDSGYRVTRGGRSVDGAGRCRSAFRTGYLPSNRGNHLGIRPAWSSP